MDYTGPGALEWDPAPCTGSTLVEHRIYYVPLKYMSKVSIEGTRKTDRTETDGDVDEMERRRGEEPSGSGGPPKTTEVQVKTEPVDPITVSTETINRSPALRLLRSELSATGHRCGCTSCSGALQGTSGCH